MITWLRSLFNNTEEADLLQLEIEELINEAEDVFDLVIIWSKLTLFTEMKNSNVDDARILRDMSLVKEVEIDKKQATVLKNKSRNNA